VADTATLARWLAEEFARNLSSAVEAMTGERAEVSTEPLASAPTPGNTDSTLFWRQPFTRLPGSAWAQISEENWIALGAHVLRASGVEEGDPGEQRAICATTLGQAFTGWAQGVAARLKNALECTGGQENSSLPEDCVWASIGLTAAAQPVHLAFGLETELLDALDGVPLARGIAGESKTFDLLLEVELPVSVSFGRTQIPLRDALKLTTGAIVELNRAVAEPVEIVVNNCVIARGEVVVVEGNFGVRIQEVISKQERLRTLQ
jgi:flagellar motor switch protein FliN/FliY